MIKRQNVYETNSSNFDLLPDLLEIQKKSFEWFLKEGLVEELQYFSPIKDYADRLELHLLPNYHLGQPKYSEEECRHRDYTYGAPLRIPVKLINKITGEEKIADTFIGDLPLITERGTFIINGAERVVVSQLVRSPGVYFKKETDMTGKRIYTATVIPNVRGERLNIEIDSNNIIYVKMEKNKKILATTLLRALGYQTHEILDFFKYKEFIQLTLDKERESLEKKEAKASKESKDGTDKKEVKTKTEDALLEIHKKLRPGEPPSVDGGRQLLYRKFFDPKRYDLGKVGRYKINKKLNLDIPLNVRVLTSRDFIAIIDYLINLYFDIGTVDDIDHLGNRRIRSVGELLQNQFHIGLARLERIVKERMTIQDIDKLTPHNLINSKPLVAAIKEFFGTSQLSQFMDQTNPLAELTHKRRLSSLGPGGLNRDRARTSFAVRDIHKSHYGRMCPIETPEGPNAGLISSLSTFARVNQFGLIETPYFKVKQGKRVLYNINNVTGLDNLGISDKIIKSLSSLKEKEFYSEKEFDKVLDSLKISAEQKEQIKVYAKKQAIYYLAADDEEAFRIAPGDVSIGEDGRILLSKVPVRFKNEFYFVDPNDVDYIGVSPIQIVSVATSVIPFLEHDDANRALMGSNMQRQSVPLINTECSYVGTGIEKRLALDSKAVVVAEEDGEVIRVTSDQIRIKSDKTGEVKTYNLSKFLRTNQDTCLNQKPIVKKGQKVKKGEVIADGGATCNGELALGRNVLVAFMPWEGFNYEDAILISERLVYNDVYTSIHIEKYETEARSTKLGDEEITRDIPNVGEEAVKNLDENGIIRIGAEVEPGDILVGKITPKGESNHPPEEKLLRAIFGEKARDCRDTSLHVPHGEKGRVVDVKVFKRDEGCELSPGVNQVVRVYLAQRRKISVGDKMSGRHGNKGIIAKILPIEDMPYLPDGTPVDIVLNPLGVPSRMNIGQIYETLLGWVGYTMGIHFEVPAFDEMFEKEASNKLVHEFLKKAKEHNTLKNITKIYGYKFEEKVINNKDLTKEEKDLLEDSYVMYRDNNNYFYKLKENLPNETIQKIKDIILKHEIYKEWFSEDGKIILYDGRTGDPFAQPITVGNIYMMKLVHLVDDKIHARSTGPYSLVTQQPLGGKAQFGGQRFGEMEVWAIEAYGAAYTLQELLTIKSDDVTGRAAAYEAIVKGKEIQKPGVPESFKVLMRELQSICLDIQVIQVKDGKEVEVPLFEEPTNLQAKAKLKQQLSKGLSGILIE